MEFSIEHITTYTYDPAAASAALRLKLFPQKSAAQVASDWQVTVNDDAVKPMLTEANGDQVALWHHHTPIEDIVISATGTVATEDTAGVLKGMPHSAPSGIYLRETGLTKASDDLRALTLELNHDDPLTLMHDLSDLVAEKISYRKGATTIDTTAAEAVAIGAGVCQDQAHVFISAARVLGIPARYVAGYMFDPDSNDAVAETHAWAEAHISNVGWIGFDITNQICPTERYVRLSSGLDASDAALIRGAFSGSGEEEMTISVRVARRQQQQ